MVADRAAADGVGDALLAASALITNGVADEALPADDGVDDALLADGGLITNAGVAAESADVADHSTIAESIYGLATILVRRTSRDLSLTAVSTLSTLLRDGPRRVTDLAGSQGVTQPSMTALVANLERAGLVRRGADPRDGRVALIALTDAGLAYVRERRRAGADGFAALLAGLSAEEISTLAAAVPALNRLRDLGSVSPA